MSKTVEYGVLANDDATPYVGKVKGICNQCDAKTDCQPEITVSVWSEREKSVMVEGKETGSPRCKLPSVI